MKIAVKFAKDQLTKSNPTAMAFSQRHDKAAHKTPVNFQSDPDPVTLSPNHAKLILCYWAFGSQETTRIWDFAFWQLWMSVITTVMTSLCKKRDQIIWAGETFVYIELVDSKLLTWTHCQW